MVLRYRVKGLSPLRGGGAEPHGLLEGFYQYVNFLFSHPILKGWGCKMSEQEQVYWRKFLETGQVTDYLRYRKYTAEQEQNPLRRIEETSRHKKFY